MTITTDHPAVSIERHDTPDHPGAVVVVTMDDGRANALATDLGRALIDVVDQVDADDTARALVIAGRDGRFSAGFDLGVSQAGDLDAVADAVGDVADKAAAVGGAAMAGVGAAAAKLTGTDDTDDDDDDEVLDLLDVAGGAVFKRFVPVAIAAVVLIVILVLLLT